MSTSISSATAEAASNIAFIKYWGSSDPERAAPRNSSISMTLSDCRSICSATHYDGESGRDQILLADERGVLDVAPESFSRRIGAHIDRLRTHFERPGTLRIATRNTFPAAAGIASSASGFTALTLAVTRALGVALSPEELSRWSRRSGSGSASRSAFGGYVEWPDSSSDDPDGSRQLLTEDAWSLCDLVAVVETRAKDVSSLEGHRRAASSPYYERRLELLPARLDEVRAALDQRDFERLGRVVEEEAIDMHLIVFSSKPAIFYWKPGTLAVLERVRQLRADGLAAYCTMDAGANVHIICQPADEQSIHDEIARVEGVQKVLRDRVGSAPVWREGAEL